MGYTQVVRKLVSLLKTDSSMFLYNAFKHQEYYTKTKHQSLKKNSIVYDTRIAGVSSQ